MAYSNIVFKNKSTGAVKIAPVGFSWTTFFFGFFPAIFRGDVKWSCIQITLAFITAGLSGVVFMFIYNKLYIKSLIKKGYYADKVINGKIDYIESKLGFEIPKYNEE